MFFDIQKLFCAVGRQVPRESFGTSAMFPGENLPFLCEFSEGPKKEREQ